MTLNAHPVNPVSPETLARFRQQQPELIEQVVARCLAEENVITQLGPNAEKRLKNGFQFTCKALNSIMQVGSASLLADQLDWANVRLPHDGISPQHLLANLSIFRDTLPDVLPAEMVSEIMPIITWMIDLQSAYTAR